GGARGDVRILGTPPRGRGDDSRRGHRRDAGGPPAADARRGDRAGEGAIPLLHRHRGPGDGDHRRPGVRPAGEPRLVLLVGLTTGAATNPSEPMTHTELTDDEYAKFCGLIYRTAGIRIADNKRVMVGNRVRRRLRATGIASFKDYFAFLTSPAGAGEM